MNCPDCKYRGRKFREEWIALTVFQSLNCCFGCERQIGRRYISRSKRSEWQAVGKNMGLLEL